MSQTFVSYSQSDRSFVARLVQDLDAKGLEVIYDQRIPVGDSWAQSLAYAIERCKYVVVVLSPDFLKSPWGEQELYMALSLETEKGAVVIPVMYRKCEPPKILAGREVVDFTGDYDRAVEKLLDLLVKTNRRHGDPLSESGGRVDDSVASELTQAVRLFKGKTERGEDSRKLEAPAKKGFRSCFVVMPFGDRDLEIVYSEFVKPVIEQQCGFDCRRGDDAFGSDVIMDDVLRSILEADLVIADLTGKNPNVFYEVGISHGLEKEVLLLAQSIEDVPFDLRHRRVLLYEYSPRGCKLLEGALKSHVLAIAARGTEGD